MKYTTMIFAMLYAIAAQAQSHKSDSLQHLNEVVVTGTRAATDIRQLSQTVTVIDRATLTENHRESILPTLAELVPGLMATGRGMMGYGVSTGAAGGMALRGISSSTGQMMVLIDGHPQYNGIYGHSIADSYQTMMAERVEVLRGPASMLYGSNAMGGVINIQTRGLNGFKEQVPGFKGVQKVSSCSSEINLGAGSYGTLEAEGSNMFRSGRFYSTIAGQYGRSDNHRPNMGFEQYGGYVKLGYDISKHWDVFADFNVTHFNASNPGTESAPKLENDQWITRYAANLVLENHYNNLSTAGGTPYTTSGAISIYDNAGRHEINDGYSPGGTPQTDLFQSKDAVAGVSLYQSITYQWANPTTITGGIDYQHIYGNAWYTNRETGETVTTKQRLKQSCDVHNNEWAEYIEVRQQLADIITLNAGIRLDNHSVAGTEWVPQYGVALRPVHNGEIKLSASKGFRNPTTKDMFLYASANDELKAERMWSYELAWRHHLLDGKLNYGVNVFYIDADNIIQTTMVNGSMKNVNTGHLYNSGVEMDVSWHIDSHWSVNTNHSWLHMENPVVSAPEYKGYLAGAWHQGKWRVSLGVMQIAGLYTAIGTNETKESFTLVNATVDYQLLKMLRLWVRGDNLLAQKYEYMAGMPMPRATFMAGVNLRF